MAKQQKITPESLPFGICYVCGGEMSRKKNEIGGRKYRHTSCGPGTKNWCEWYDRTGRNTDAGKLLRDYAKKESKKASERLRALSARIKKEKEQGLR